MTVINVDKDLDRLTITLVAAFDAPVERAWELWADPRQLERWWGPPGAPATVEEHDLVPGGRVTYFMTLPDGSESRGWWRITAVDPPRGLAFTDGWGDPDRADTHQGTTAIEVQLTEHEDGTRMQMRSTFTSREQMDEVLRMGADVAMRAAVDQIDALLVNA
jgi:uncharacterized protein YndB with AHSA1/START domain